MKQFLVVAAAVLATACASRQPPLEALWYARNNDESVNSFGAVDARVIAAARARCEARAARHEPRV